MRANESALQEGAPKRDSHSYRRLFRVISCLCMLSAIPGFWPAVITFAFALAAFLIPSVGILAGLMVMQVAVYAAFKRLGAFGIAGHDDPCYQAQIIDRR